MFFLNYLQKHVEMALAIKLKSTINEFDNSNQLRFMEIKG